MAETDWKPGDVAMVTWRGMGITREDMRLRGTTRSGTNAWWDAEGTWIGDETAKAVRRLLVIDPEDREQIERLDVAYQAALDSAPKYHGLADVMQQALRAMLAPPKPPKPEEPLGLGAVVVDSAGGLWVLCATGRGMFRKCNDPNRGCFWSWKQIDAVEVLSQGVTS